MRSYGGVVSAFARVRKPCPNVYTEAAQTPKVPQNPGEPWDSGTVAGGKKILDGKQGE